MHIYVIQAEENGAPSYVTGAYTTGEKAIKAVYKHFGIKLVKDADPQLKKSNRW